MRDCSLLDGLEIVRSDLSSWKELSQYHYRHHWAGAADKVFAIRCKKQQQESKISRLVGRGERALGVIVYGMPVFSVALRNRATGNRYVWLGDRATTMRLINQELRCINRVVIQPQYRGIGLGHWLVAKTLPQAGTVMVEALAVMGKVNPFFERAGMRRYEGDFSTSAQRMVGAFEHVGIEQEQLVDSTVLLGAIGELEQDDQKLIVSEMYRFVQTFGRSGRKLTNRMSWREYFETREARKQLVELVVNHVLSRPTYYLWRRR